ncbi:hypothetical protein H0H93_014965 [Arthromyces matolae]|nr:hypothetical protein H0H93_014965 [Arthromyces matolae]
MITSMTQMTRRLSMVRERDEVDEDMNTITRKARATLILTENAGAMDIGETPGPVHPTNHISTRTVIPLILKVMTVYMSNDINMRIRDSA